MEHKQIVVLDSVTRRFGLGTRAVLALDEVSADISTAGLTCIAGPSGSGKSTLVNLIGCLDRAESGNVIVAGIAVNWLSQRRRRHFRRRMIGLLASVPTENLISTMDVAANLQLAARQRRSPALTVAEVAAALDRVGIGGSQQRWTSELSGGEQLRLGVACALIGEPSLILVDEPTASLDRVSAESIVEVFRALTDTGTSVIIATHDHHVLDRADAIIRLEHGRRVS